MTHHPLSRTAKGQGLQEAAIVIVLVAVVVAGGLKAFEAGFENHMGDVANSVTLVETSGTNSLVINGSTTTIEGQKLFSDDSGDDL